MNQRESPARRKAGCAGCLGQVALILLAGGALLLGLLALLAPWNFYFGGHFHAVPGWAGWGRMHSTAAGGDYYMYVYFEPTTPGYRKSPIKGIAYLCTPRGERYRLRFGGDMPRKHGTDLRGVPIHLYMSNQALRSRLLGDRRPHLDLYGTFGNSELIMEDRGTLAAAFAPDGALYRANDRNRSTRKEDIHVTFEERSPWFRSS